jgi:hypothetical protein
MQSLSYYIEDLELEHKGITYYCEVEGTGFYSFYRGDGHNNPPEEILESDYTRVLSAWDEEENKVTDKDILDALEWEHKYIAEELLKEEIE